MSQHTQLSLEEVRNRETAVELLKRALSPQSQQADEQVGRKQEPLRIIGLGTCGTVFEIPGTERAYKKGSDQAALWRDFCYTNKVYCAVADTLTALQEAFPNLSIPRAPMCYDFHLATHEKFWANALPLFPASHRTKQPLFSVDRILPLPEEVQHCLIDMFFDESETVQKEAKQDPENKDCLVRVYLGEEESIEQQSAVYDSLRNFPMRLNMMEDLGLEINELAAEMAVGLAIVHWQAQVDGMDMEFVLGCSATGSIERPRPHTDVSVEPYDHETIKFRRRAIHLWMLDFDKANLISLTEEDVKKKLVPAFIGNDPYYPTPYLNRELWDQFSSTYLKASAVILKRKGVDSTARRLPRVFLDEVQRVSAANKAWDEEDYIVFAE
ncbi:hypothetical protein G7Y79_00074g098550 [Physcia stellaris]|nr:hypothetical protein G7Y79_00074g098550 [Physcia stellaris]